MPPRLIRWWYNDYKRIHTFRGGSWRGGSFCGCKPPPSDPSQLYTLIQCSTQEWVSVEGGGVVENRHNRVTIISATAAIASYHRLFWGEKKAWYRVFAHALDLFPLVQNIGLKEDNLAHAQALCTRLFFLSRRAWVRGYCNYSYNNTLLFFSHVRTVIITSTTVSFLHLINN